MSNITTAQLEAVAARILEIVEDETDEAAEYARDFARYSAEYATAALLDPHPDSVERFEAQTRAVAETIREIGDQAAQRIIFRLVDGLRILLAVTRAA